MINPEKPNFDNTPVSVHRPAHQYDLASSPVQPAVSIITPFYNVEPDIFAETAQSVRQQTLQQWEWIIVNDGSTQPETLQPLAELAREDPRIKIIHLPENRGLSAARNVGLAAACADFAVLLDGDDLLEPTAVEKWLWFLFTRPQLGFTRGYSVRFGATPHLWERSFENIEAFLIKNQMEPTAMVRREVWQQTGGFDEAMRLGLEDWEFWLKCAAHGFWGATVPEYLNWYRLRPQQKQRWPALKNDKTRLAVRDDLQQRYPALFAGQLPAITATTPAPPLIPLPAPCANTVVKADGERRVLLIANTFDAALQANLLEPLLAAAAGLSICATRPGQLSGMAQAACFTPDVFVLPNFLQPQDYPRFLAYLITSRQVDVVLIYGSDIGFQVFPFLKTRFSELVGVGYVDDDTGAVNSLRVRAWLSCTVAESPSRRDWLLGQGDSVARVEANPDWRWLLSTLQPDIGSPLPDTGEAMARLLATLAAVGHQPAGSIVLAEESGRGAAPRPADDLSGEELAGLLSARKLLKALGFKLGHQPGFRWLYRFKALGKRIVGG